MCDTVRRRVACKTQLRRSKVLNSNIGHNYSFKVPSGACVILWRQLLFRYLFELNFFDFVYRGLNTKLVQVYIEIEADRLVSR